MFPTKRKRKTKVPGSAMVRRILSLSDVGLTLLDSTHPACHLHDHHEAFGPYSLPGVRVRPPGRADDCLASRGITAVLLKYRVPAPRSKPYNGAYPESPMALEDAQRTIGLVRLRAAGWHIDPHKIGVIGFSAGGHLVAATSTHFDDRL